MNDNTTEAQNQEVIEVKRKRLPFTMVENAIIRDESISKHALIVYLVLCMHADKNGKNCYPTLKKIANESRSDKRTVLKAINELVESEYILKEHRMNPDNPKEFTSNLYTIIGGSGKEYPRVGTKQHQGGSGKQHQKQDPSFEQDPLNNNTTAAVSVITEKNGKIEFTWPEVQKICNKISNTKEFVINRIDTAIARIERCSEPRDNPKGWIIKAIIDGYNLDTVTKEPGPAPGSMPYIVPEPESEEMRKMRKEWEKRRDMHPAYQS